MSLQSEYKNSVAGWLSSPFNLSLILLSFSLPFGSNYNSWFLVLSIALFGWGCLRKNYSFKQAPPWQLLIPCLFYLMWVIGYFYSDDKANALSELELKLTLLIFPLMLFYSYKDIDVKSILLAFVAGCMVAALFCLGRATGIYLSNHDSSAFVYAPLSYFMHPGYFAMYLIFSSLIIFLWNRELAGPKSGKIKFFLVILLCLFHYLVIVLLSTRANIIALLAVFIVLGFSFLMQKTYRKQGLILLGGLLVILLAIFISFNSGQNFRFSRMEDIFSEKKIDPSTDESVDVRLLIWKASVVVIKINFWVGAGTGDGKNLLAEEYKTEKLTGAEEKGLNAHNEFIQTFLAIGVIGFLLLLLTLFAGIPASIKQGHILLLCFILLIVINFFTESMLERQAGVVFFSFFNSLLILRELKNKT